jgi:glucosyl-dolichyl phosphate glucuronosyltransferase
VSERAPVRMSIIVCTRNRAELLAQSLDALIHQEGVAADAYEVIVVDNGSTDDSRHIIQTAQRQSARVRYLYEPRLGLSVARNAGTAQAWGDIVCFGDDDAVAAPDFVREVLSCFQDPQVTCVGGKIVAAWPDGGPPEWFAPRYGNVVGQTSFGETARWLRKYEFPFGGNLSLKKEVLHRLGGFNENLGKKGENNVWGEEMDLCHRMQRQGLRFLYNPRARVSHIVGWHRATKRYFIDTIFGKGVTEGYQKLVHRGRFIFGVYLVLKACRLAVTSAYYLSAGTLLSEATRFRLRCTISWYAGYLHFLAVRDDFGSTPSSAD